MPGFQGRLTSLLRNTPLRLMVALWANYVPFGCSGCLVTSSLCGTLSLSTERQQQGLTGCNHHPCKRSASQAMDSFLVDSWVTQDFLLLPCRLFGRAGSIFFLAGAFGHAGFFFFITSSLAMQDLLVFMLFGLVGFLLFPLGAL